MRRGESGLQADRPAVDVGGLLRPAAGQQQVAQVAPREDVAGLEADRLAELGVRPDRVTPQRQLVLEAVTKLEHATPEEIFACIRQTARGMNVSTVYRTLELLEQIARGELPAPPLPATGSVEPPVWQILDALRALPAYVANARWDVVASDRQAAKWR